MTRTTITIVGHGKRMKGVSSKTGKPYDFQSISFTYADRFTDGCKADTVTMQGPDIDAAGGFILGEVREAVISTDKNGNVFGLCLL